MGIPIFKIFTIFGLVSTWAESALADGKVTLMEAVDLVTKLAAILGIRTELEIPVLASVPLPETGNEIVTKIEEEDRGHERPPPKPE